MRAPGNFLLFTDEVSWRQVITKLSGGVDESLIESNLVMLAAHQLLPETVLSKLRAKGPTPIWQAGMADLESHAPHTADGPVCKYSYSPTVHFFFLIGLLAALEVTNMV